MPDHNVYLAYKRDNQFILYWLIDAWNTIIKKKTATGSSNQPPLQPNTTGKITVLEILSMCELIAAQPLKPEQTFVLDIVLRLFHPVTKRVQAHQYPPQRDAAAKRKHDRCNLRPTPTNRASPTGFASTARRRRAVTDAPCTAPDALR